MGRKKDGKNTALAITMPRELTLKPREWFKPYAKNARTHSDTQIDQLCASMREFGFTNPVLAHKDGTIIAGHGRLEAATRLSIPQLPVLILGHLTETQRRKLVIADNKLAENAGWDNELLADELHDILQDSDLDNPDLLASMGFDQEEMDTLLEGLHDQPPEDDEPETIGEDEITVDLPVSAVGDVWVMGNHRLICGDAQNTEQLEKLMEGKKAAMIFTDPPYGVDTLGGRTDLAKGSGRKKIENDTLVGKRLTDFLTKALDHKIYADSCSFYIFYNHTGQTAFCEAVEKLKWNYVDTIVWNKNVFGLSGFRGYRPKHEFILFGSVGKEYPWYGENDQANVWDFARPTDRVGNHPTPKPVDLIEKALINSTVVRDLVIDFFGGSGSTLMACEKQRRHARIIEIDPIYCDVIVRRWQNFTGKKALLESTNRTFGDMKEARSG